MTWNGSPHAGTQLTITTERVKLIHMMMMEKRAACIQPVDNLRRVVANAVLLRQLLMFSSVYIPTPGFEGHW